MMCTVGQRQVALWTYDFQLEDGGWKMVTREYVTFTGLALMMILSVGCSQVVNVYWTKTGAGKAQLQEDVEECQSLQRRVGLNEERIEQCLEAQGWSAVRQEPMEEEPEPDIQNSEPEE